MFLTNQWEGLLTYLVNQCKISDTGTIMDKYKFDVNIPRLEDIKWILNDLKGEFMKFSGNNFNSF